MKTKFALTLVTAFALTASSMAQAGKNVCSIQELLNEMPVGMTDMTEVLEQIQVAGTLKKFLDARTEGDKTLLDWYKKYDQYGVGVEAAMRNELKPIADKFNSTYCTFGDVSGGNVVGREQCVDKNGKLYDANVRSITLKADRYNKNGPKISIEGCNGPALKQTCISINLLDNVDDYAELETKTDAVMKKINAKNSKKSTCLHASKIDAAGSSKDANAPKKSSNKNGEPKKSGTEKAE